MVTLVLGLIARLFGFSILKLMRIFKDELVLAYSTASSETVLPRVIGRMTWVFYLTGVGRDAAVQSHEHDELLIAIADGNDRLAESLAFSHIEKGRAPSLELILAGR